MKIKNDYVTIQMGNKQYEFKNLIFDEYLKRIISRQLDEENFNAYRFMFYMKNLLIKFDTPFENLDSSTVLHNQDFDICLVSYTTHEQEISPKSISMKCTYNGDTDFVVWDYARNTAVDNYINNYYGRKITALGFNSTHLNDTNLSNPIPVCAVLDTTNYNLYLQENQLFTVTRKDTISTDAEFYSKFPAIKAPAHLCPIGINSNREIWQYNYYGILYSVGFGNHIDTMLTEEIIGDNVSAVQDNTDIIIGDITNTELNNRLIYPKINLFPKSNVYPIKDNYKYVILKYKVYRYEMINNEATYIDTGMYYYQAIPISEYGTGTIKIKYERG